MGHVIYCYICCIFDIALYTDDTLFDFLLKYGFR